MKNIKKLCALSLALSFGLSPLTASINPSYANQNQSPRLDLGVKNVNVDFREKSFSLNQNEALKNEALKEIRAIRSRLWDENVPYTLDEKNDKKEKLQDVAKAYGYKNKESYVNAISWNTDLEKIAIQRAYEQTVREGHQRPDGSDSETAVSKNGIVPEGEIIASNTNPETPALAFNQWSFHKSKSKNYTSEYEFLLKSNGVFNKDNGHLHLILDPNMKHFGFATLNNTGTKWNYGVGIFNSGINNSNTASANIVGEYRLYVGNPSTAKEENKAAIKSDEEKLRDLERVRDEAKMQITVVENLMENYPATVAKVRDKLIVLLNNAKVLIERADKVLNK